ncbi:MAG: glycosidase, partial [Planctomycetes bacterium]|nr:glycosidase [Planctomycetota bacterium]
MTDPNGVPYRFDSMRKMGRDVIHRWEGNPIITLDHIPFPCNTVFNAACTKYGEEYILLLRVEDLKGRSVLAVARGEDGFHFQVGPEPVLIPSEEEPFAAFESMGVEDPRITEIEGVYYIMYTAVSCYGPRLALARTTDFERFERIALVSEPENKDGVLFPRKVGDRYVRLDRPMTEGLGNIWISYSKNLKDWGDSRLLAAIRPGFWDCHRIGASAPPLETEKGW